MDEIEDGEKPGDGWAAERDDGAKPAARSVPPGLLAARNVAIAVTAVAGVCAAGLIGRNPVELMPVYLVVLMLTPMLVLALMRFWPELYGVFPLNGVLRRNWRVPRKDPRNDLFPTLVLASLGLSVCGLNGPSHMGHMISYAPLLLWAAPLAGAHFIGFMSTGGKGVGLDGAVAVLVLACAVQPISAAAVANTEADRSVPQRVIVPVTGHYALPNAPRIPGYSYYLNLAAEPPFARPVHGVSVSEPMYRYAKQYGWACVQIHAGALHVPWYEPVDCEGGE